MSIELLSFFNSIGGKQAENHGRMYSWDFLNIRESHHHTLEKKTNIQRWFLPFLNQTKELLLFKTCTKTLNIFKVKLQSFKVKLSGSITSVTSATALPRVFSERSPSKI